MSFDTFTLLQPAGAIGLAERGLMVNAVLLMLIVVVPVFFLIFFFAWRYRDRSGGSQSVSVNQKDATGPKYTPDWAHAKVDELIWWAIPLEIVLVLGALTWTSTHELDPRRPLESEQAPIVVEVVALNWKWLFIYPEQGVASLNYVAMPVDRPVEFRITADAPMNSFWIPQLGGQIYAMTGMSTTLHLEASRAGKYAGLSANYSGEGFAQMKFIAEAMPQADFDAWIDLVQSSPNSLDAAAYERLAKPSTGDGEIYYGAVASRLYDSIVGKFMGSPMSETHHH